MKSGLFMLAILMVLGVGISACSKEKSLENGGSGLRTVEFELNEVNSSGVGGNIVISENGDSTFNVLVNLSSSVKDTVHVLHIHNGTIDSPGSIAINLTPVTGTGIAVQSLTGTIREVVLPDNSRTPMSYEDMLHFEGFVDVHFSADIDSLIAQGTIGN